MSRIRTFAAVSFLGAALLSVYAHATPLQQRDLTGDGIADALYDADRGITWLRNANPIGYQNWYTSKAWVEALSIGGYSDWRQPKGDDLCTGYYCLRSELGHLWYEALGNGFDGTNYGDFVNFSRGVYWSGFDGGAYPSEAWTFEMGRGIQLNLAKTGGGFTLAVYDGDIGQAVSSAVPAPRSDALSMIALFAAAYCYRRKRAHHRDA